MDKIKIITDGSCDLSHEVLNKFFCLINGTSNETEQIEQIEHFINKHTIENIELLIPTLEYFKNNKYSIKI